MDIKRFWINRNFGCVLFARLISFSGTCMQGMVISLFLMDKTSAQMLAMVLAISVIPQILLGPFCGLLADFVDKRKIIVMTDFFNFLIALSLFFLSNEKGIPVHWLYVSGFLFSLFTSFFAPAIDSIFPELVPKKELVKANAMYSAVLDIVQLTIPPIAALIYSFAGIRFAFAVNAISFLISFFSLLGIKKDVKTIPSQSCQPLETKGWLTLSNLMEPFRYLKSQKILRTAILYAIFLDMLMNPLYSIGFISLIKKTLALSNFHFGIFDSILLLGSFSGSFFVSKKTTWSSIIKNAYRGALWIVFLLMGLLCVLIDISRWGSMNSYFCIVLIGMALSVVLRWMLVPIHSFLQLETHPLFLGRITSICWMASLCVHPIGQLALGWMVDRDLFKWYLLFAMGALVIMAKKMSGQIKK